MFTYKGNILTLLYWCFNIILVENLLLEHLLWFMSPKSSIIWPELKNCRKGIYLSINFYLLLVFWVNESALNDCDWDLNVGCSISQRWHGPILTTCWAWPWRLYLTTHVSCSVLQRNTARILLTHSPRWWQSIRGKLISIILGWLCLTKKTSGVLKFTVITDTWTCFYAPAINVKGVGFKEFTMLNLLSIQSM